MKFFKWKQLIVASLVCLLPVLLGISLWDSLPDTIAIHFDVYGNPDNFASKGFVVFALPLLMAVLNAVLCILTDFKARKHGSESKAEAVVKWILPCLTVILQVITFGYSLGWNLDIRKCVMIIVGGLLMVTGNYMPKLSYVKNCEMDTEKARKINRLLGYETVLMGVLFLISGFLPAIASVICLCLLIPYIIVAAIYGALVGRK